MVVAVLMVCKVRGISDLHEGCALRHEQAPIRRLTSIQLKKLRHFVQREEHKVTVISTSPVGPPTCPSPPYVSTLSHPSLNTNRAYNALPSSPAVDIRQTQPPFESYFKTKFRPRPEVCARNLPSQPSWCELRRSPASRPCPCLRSDNLIHTDGTM